VAAATRDVGARNRHLYVFSLNDQGARSDPVIPVQSPHAELKLSYGFAADHRFVFIDDSRAVRCWDLREVKHLWDHPVNRSLALAISPDGTQIAYEFRNVIADGSRVAIPSAKRHHHVARVLSAATGEPVGGPIIHKNHIIRMAWHPDGKQLLTCSEDHSAIVTDIDAGKPTVAVVPHNGSVSCGTWSPDGNLFATAQWHDRLTRVWKMPRIRPRDFLAKGENSQGFIKSSAGSHAIVLSGFDMLRTQRRVQVYDSGTGQPQGACISENRIINDAVYLPRGNVLVTGTSSRAESTEPSLFELPLNDPGEVHFWNAKTGEICFPSIKTRREPIALGVDPQETTLAVLCDGGQLQLIDPQTGRLRVELSAYQAAHANKGMVIRDRIRFSPDGGSFALWGFGSEVQLRESATGALLHQFRHPHSQDYLHDARFSPDGLHLATCSSDQTVRIWEVKSGAEIAALLHTGWVFNARFDATGEVLATACEDRQARLWNWKKGELLLATPDVDDQIYGVTFASDEGTFIAASRAGAIYAWERETGKQIAPSLDYHNMAYQVEIDQSGQYLLVAGRLGGVARVRLDSWMRKSKVALPGDDLTLLAEIIANQKVLATGVPATLNTNEWYSRWTAFQKKYPQHPVFQRP
jgi:WD40 repeat protein